MFPKTLFRELMETSLRILAVCWMLSFAWALVQPALPLLFYSALIVGFLRLRNRW